MILDLTKPTNPKVPFFAVERFSNGSIYSCVKNPEYTCQLCLFYKCCPLKSEVEDDTKRISKISN